MTAYEVIPVGTRAERERSQVIDAASYHDLLAENLHLRDAVAAAKADADVWHQAWATAVNNRTVDRERLSRAMRVLASLGRLSPRMADVVAAAGREIWRLDRADLRRQSKSTRNAREICSRARREVWGDLP